MSLNEKIKIYRQQKKISQRELGRRINKTGQLISSIERGETTPSMDTIKKIANALETPIDSFFEVDITLSKRLIDSLELPILKKIGFADTLEVLSEDLDINYELLDECVKGNLELSIDVQEKLLKALAGIDFNTFLEFIETNKKDLQKIDRLDRLVSELYMEQIHDLDKKSLDILKSYILLVFGKNVQEVLNNDVLHELQKEIQSFLKFKLFELEKKSYEDDK